MAVAQRPDMYPVCTTYAGEIAPQRSLRETVSLRAVPHFLKALEKALPSESVDLVVPRFADKRLPA